jgi:hypothetical protein|tara:strand:+ start:407 stop:1204 length:798 start_codon:yes stop_codon:yes gene_type:complete
MSRIEKISTSNVKITDLHEYNEIVNTYSKEKNLIGKKYTTSNIIWPEPKQKEHPWEYAINSYGFRGLDWTYQKSPAFFGCSCTFGFGVETPVSELFAKKLGVDVIPNLGIPGGGFVNIIKLFSAFTRLHPVSDAIIMLPAINRAFVPEYQLAKKTWIHRSFILNYPRSDKKFFKKVVSVFNNDVLLSYFSDYIDWATEIAENRGITIHWGSWDTDVLDLLRQKNINATLFRFDLDKAADDLHPGPKCHEDLSNVIYEKITKKDNT